jgi:ADP-heptose:LPS heptosyltransferase
MKAVYEYLKLFYYLLRPKSIFVRRISGAVGDNILLSAILPGLKEKYPDYKIIVETPKPELFENNPLVDWCTTRHFKTTKKFVKPKYRIFPETKASIIEQILSYIPENKYRTPKIYLTESEIAKVGKEFSFPYIAIAPTGKTKFAANRKEWGIENFQKVRDMFPDIKFVQIGMYEMYEEYYCGSSHKCCR